MTRLGSVSMPRAILVFLSFSLKTGSFKTRKSQSEFKIFAGNRPVLPGPSLYASSVKSANAKVLTSSSTGGKMVEMTRHCQGRTAWSASLPPLRTWLCLTMEAVDCHKTLSAKSDEDLFGGRAGASGCQRLRAYDRMICMSHPANSLHCRTVL